MKNFATIEKDKSCLLLRLLFSNDFMPCIFYPCKIVTPHVSAILDHNYSPKVDNLSYDWKCFIYFHSKEAK